MRATVNFVNYVDDVLLFALFKEENPIIPAVGTTVTRLGEKYRVLEVDHRYIMDPEKGQHMCTVNVKIKRETRD